MLVFRQLFDLESSTYTYLLADATQRAAVIIDAVFEQVERDLALLRELELELVAVLDTHCHADHVTGAWLLAQRTGARIGVGAHGGVEGADRYLRQGDRVVFGQRHLSVRETPGHTAGCLTYVLDDASMAFTGDALLIRSCGRTDFQQGDPAQLYHSVHTQIFSLPEATQLYPAHDYNGRTVTSVGEERRFNPRLGGEIAASDFIGYMRHLGLPHPKKIDSAVPANLVCGRPQDGHLPEQVPDWAPLRYTFAGIWEIEPQWLEERGGQVQIVDVREPDEYVGPLGHIAGAVSIPLGNRRPRGRDRTRAPRRHRLSRRWALGAGHRSCAVPASTRQPISPAACCAGGHSGIP